MVVTDGKKKSEEMVTRSILKTQAGHKAKFLPKVSRAALAQVTKRNGRASIVERF